VEEGEPWEEYVHRIKMGINNAAARGFPRWYIDKYFRGYIPPEEKRRPLRVSSPRRLFVMQLQTQMGRRGGEVGLSALFERA